MQPSSSSWTKVWPALAYGAWKDTCSTLHLWTQIVGKVRLAQTPWVNHAWHVTLYVTPRGLTTPGIPYNGRVFQIDFDFIDHALLIRVSDGSERQLPLGPRPVAEFHDQLIATLVELGIQVRIHGNPNELADHPGGVPNLPDSVTREAYSHDVSSAGFRPGGGATDHPAFYSYA